MSERYTQREARGLHRMKTLKSLLLTLLLVIVVVGVSLFGTIYAREQGWIKGKEVIEEPDAYEDDSEEGEGDDWAAANGEAEWPYIVPTEGPAVTAAKVTFAYQGKAYTLEPQVDSSVYHGAVAAVRGYEVPTDADDEAKEGYLIAYYNKLAYDPEMDATIEGLLKAFQGIRDKAGLDSDQYVELLTKYVQSIPYDSSRGTAATSGKDDGDPRMPIQVIADGKGDCDEKVMLLATLLTHEGYEVQGFFFEAEKHMALGIQAGDGDGYDGLGYSYIETTGIAYVSEVPTELVGGFKLESEPQVIPFGDDEIREGEYSEDAIAQVKRIVKVRKGAMKAAKKQKTYIENTSMSKAEYNKEEAKYEACYFADNSFRATVDANGNPTNEFMDRVPAIKWIDANAWW
jgi:hypothetical protein